MNVHARFSALDANEARAMSPVPLLIGLTGPSGSGKTFSALRIASGIQEVVGGDIYMVDTEQRRALHYADKFKFKHVEFQAPFGSLDYLEVLRFCKNQGAGVVVIDSASHEHDGPGGLLEQHAAEMDRIDPTGKDFRKRDKMQMVGWAKIKPARRKLINAITTELAMPVIFCFRAKKSVKPVRGGEPVDMGFSTIGADEWLFEMALNALFLPGSNGVPTWQSDLPGERLAIKLPEQFRAIADRGGPMTEAIGRSLAKWASGKASGDVKAEPRQFTAKPTQAPEPEGVSPEWTTNHLAEIDACTTIADLDRVIAKGKGAVAKLNANEATHDLRDQVLQAYTIMTNALTREGKPDDQMGEGFGAGDRGEG